MNSPILVRGSLALATSVASLGLCWLAAYAFNWGNWVAEHHGPDQFGLMAAGAIASVGGLFAAIFAFVGIFALPVLVFLLGRPKAQAGGVLPPAQVTALRLPGDR